jgi:hypothetical protein
MRIFALILSMIIVEADFRLIGDNKYKTKAPDGSYLFIRADDGGNDWEYDTSKKSYWRYKKLPLKKSRFTPE